MSAWASGPCRRRSVRSTYQVATRDATRELEQDDVLRAALGRAVDEDYVDYYIRVKRREWASYHEQVTPWEVDQYLMLT